MSLQRGDRVLIFDAIAWGGKDVGDNSKFYLPATVEDTYFYPGKGIMVDVTFDHRPKNISKDHFITSIRRKIT